MTTPNPRRATKEPRATVPADAPVRGYRAISLTRDEWEAARTGQTIEQVKAARTRILATDAREPGACR